MELTGDESINCPPVPSASAPEALSSKVKKPTRSHGRGESILAHPYVQVHLFPSGSTAATRKTLNVLLADTLERLLQLAEQEGLPLEDHCICILPRAELEMNRLMPSLQREPSQSPTTYELWKKTNNEHHTPHPIHGFLPLIMRNETAFTRDEMNRLEHALGEQHGIFSEAQVEHFNMLVNEEKNFIRQELQQVTAMYETLRSVVYDLQVDYRNIYSSVHGLIRSMEGDAIERLTSLTSTVEMPIVHALAQTTGDLATLMQTAFRIKTQMFDRFLSDIAAGLEHVQFYRTKLKGLWRCVEKMMIRAETTDSCAGICDVVRGTLSSNSVADLVLVLRAMIESDKVKILRVKNRLKEANDSGWADCLVNFVFTEDPTAHICEVQLVHEKFLLVRKNMGAHFSYSFFRSALEMLETTDDWHDERALVDIFRGTNGVGWKEKGGWATACTVRDWYGVTANSHGKVVELDLSDNNLRGKLPESIGRLTSLVELDLSENLLEGPIPESIGSLQELTELVLSDNNFEGAVPVSIEGLTALRGLYLGYNYELTISQEERDRLGRALPDCELSF